MVGQPPDPGGAPGQTRYSQDGFWWWDGAQWRPAVSPDGLWRWNGQAWVPAQPAARAQQRTGCFGWLGVVAGFAAVLVVVALVVMVILYTMGDQISNVFSNVAAALGG